MRRVHRARLLESLSQEARSVVLRRRCKSERTGTCLVPSQPPSSGSLRPLLLPPSFQRNDGYIKLASLWNLLACRSSCATRDGSADSPAQISSASIGEFYFPGLQSLA